MYGTVARFTAKPGTADALKALSDEGPDNPDGYLFHHIFKLDSGENDYFLVVGFSDRESYTTNAETPEANEFYEKFRSLLVADPEWMDGEIVNSTIA